MSDSYARIETSEAKHLATRTIEVIEAERKALVKRWVDTEKTKRERWRRWFPFLKSLTDVEARRRVKRSGKTSEILYWTAYARAKAILNLVKAAGSDPFIYITSDDYQRILFGVTHDLLKQVA